MFSFSDVIKQLSQLDTHDPAYISSSLAAIEHYVIVHGQVILQQFNAYHAKDIQRCAFVIGLLTKMQETGHRKLMLKKPMLGRKASANLNPNAALFTSSMSLSKRKAMRATTTKLVNMIWRDYFEKYFPVREVDRLDLKQEEEEVEDDEGEEQSEDDIEGLDIFVQD